MRTCSMLALACGLVLIGALSGADWPGWRGPDRTAAPGAPPAAPEVSD